MRSERQGWPSETYMLEGSMHTTSEAGVKGT